MTYRVMKTATFQFLNGLDDFLDISKRSKSSITVTFNWNQSVKHLIESFRIPHTEVGEIQVNGCCVEFSYIVQDGDSVRVSPSRFGNYNVSNSEELISLMDKPRFIIDNHLGKLATYLRILGFDTLYRNDYQDKELAQVAQGETRILVTRDRGLLMRRTIQYGYCVRSLNPKEQLLEIIKRFDLDNKIQPFKRCLRCNECLEPISKKSIIDRLQPLTKKYYKEFHICPACGQIYWRGSHYKHMSMFLKKIFAEIKESKNEH